MVNRGQAASSANKLRDFHWGRDLTTGTWGSATHDSPLRASEEFWTRGATEVYGVESPSLHLKWNTRSLNIVFDPGVLRADQ